MLKLFLVSYGAKTGSFPSTNPVKRFWYNLIDRLPIDTGQTRRLFRTDVKGATFWFEEYPPENPYQRAPWLVASKNPPGVTPAWQYTSLLLGKGVAGLYLDECPTNMPTVTFAFFRKPRGVSMWSEDLNTNAWLGEITVKNPAYK